MNKNVYLITLTVLFIFISIPVNITQQAAYTPQNYLTVINANRQISVNTYGQVVVNDTLLVANNGSTSTDYVVIGVYSDFNSYINYVGAVYNGLSLQVSNRFTINSNISGYAILLPSALTPSSTVNITVTMVYTRIILSKGVGEYSLTIPRYPILPYNITYMTGKISTPGVRTTPSYSTYTASNLTAYNYVALKIEYAYSGTPLAEYNMFKRSLEINPWLGLKIIETHNLTILNTGVTSGITTFTVATLPYAQNFKVYDYTGILTYNQVADGNITLITVNFRYTVYSNQSYLFIIEYWLPIESYRGQTSTGIRLQTSPPQYTAREYSLNIKLSESSIINSYTAPSDYNVQATLNTLTITRVNATSYNTGIVEFTYTIGLADIIGRPLLISAVTGILLTAFIAWRLKTRREEEAPVEVKIEEKPKELISLFCKLYEDKTALAERLERLEVDYLKGKIRKIEYQKRRTAYITELERVDRELKPLKEDLSRAGSSYARTVTTIEEFELEKETAQRQLQDLRNRYLNKRVTAATYNRLKDELEKKIMKLSQRIDRKILELRQEAA